jgi:pyruvate dehydrogenase E2 component (dihydrolipoamide acetyltransferase)
MSEQQHLDAKAITGTGAKGKIVKRDIELLMGVDLNKQVQVTTAAAIEIDYNLLPSFTRKKNSGMRTVVADRLTESSRDIPHFYMTVDCQIDSLLAMRKQLNERKNATYKISVNDFVIKAVAAAMAIVPEANCMWDGDSVIYFDQVDVSIAVAVNDGLITPVVKNAGGIGLASISNVAKELAIGAREGKLKPADYQGGTFTISNLGMFGIDNFTSIINPPQNGILSVGAGQQKPIVVDGELSIATIMSVTLAMDHRCVDGAIGARFIIAFKEIIEDPISIIL